MADDLRILLSAGLNVGKSIGDINTAISGIQKKVNKLKLNIDVSGDFTRNIQAFITAVEKVKRISDEQNKTVSESQEVYKKLDGTITTLTTKVLKNGEILQKTKTVHDENKKAMQDESVAALKLAESVEKQNKADMDSITILKNKADAVKGYKVVSSQGYTVTTKRLESDAETLIGSSTTTNYKKQRADEQKAQEDNLKATRANLLQEEREHKSFVENTKKQYDSLQATIRKNLLQEDRDTEDFINKAKKEYDSLIKKQEELVLKIGDVQRRFAGDKNLTSNLSGLLGDAKSINIAQDGAKQIDNLNRKLKEYVNTANSARSNSISFAESLSTAMQKFPVWMAATTAFYLPLHMIESGVKYIYDLDTAMTDLQKVTDETSSTYAQFTQQAAQTANQIGALTLDVIKSTTEWARLGYTLQQAQQLAKQSTIYQNVGDISSAEEASKDLISAIKGFNIEIDANGKNMEHLIDVYNEVGNKYSISSAGIGEAARRGASALHEAGNTMEQSVALITAANSAVQDPAKVGNALKTISLRLRGVSEDGQDVSDLMPTLEKKFQSVGLTLKKDETTFKSTYEIFSDLSKVFGSLNGLQKSDFLELIAGKEQANIAASLLSNWSDAEGALRAGLNSFGSAARENEKYLESMRGKLAQLQNATTTFWQKSMDSSVLKSAIDLATKFVNALDNLGNVIAITSGLLLVFKTKAIAGLISGAISSVQSLFTMRAALTSTATTAEATTVAVNGTSVAMTGLQRALGIIGLVLTAGSLLYTVLNQVSASNEKVTKTIDDLNKKFEDNAYQIANASSYYEENRDKIQSNAEVKDQLFAIQNKLIDTFGEEAKGIDLVNGKYDEQIKKIGDLNKANLDAKIKDSEIAVNQIKDKRYSSPVLGYDPTYLNVIGEASRSYDVGGDFGNVGNLGLEEYYKKLLKLQDDIRDKNVSIFDSQKLIPQNAEEWANALKTVQDKIQELKPLYDQINALEAAKKESIKNSTLEQTKFNAEQQSAFDKINASLSDQSPENYEKSISKITEIISSANGDNLTQVIDKIKELPEVKMDDSILNSLNKLQGSISDATKETFSLASVQKTLTDSYLKTYQAVEPLNTAIDKYRNGQQLTSGEIEELLKKYPELYNSMTVENGHLQINIKALEEKRNAEIDGMNIAISSQQSQVESLEKTLVAKLQAYGVEIDAIQSVAQAKQKLAEAEQNLNNSFNPNGSEFEQIGKLKDLGAVETQVLEIAKAKDAIESLKKAASTGFNFQNNNNTQKEKEKQDTQATLHTLTDFSKEEISNINNVISARDNNIKSLEKQLEVAKKTGDYTKIIAAQNDLLSEQKGKLDDISTANSNLTASADKVRTTYQTLGDKFSQNGVGFDAWFNSDSSASETYIKAIQDIDKAMQGIEGDGKNLSDDQQNQIKSLENQKNLYQTIFSQLQGIKQAWTGNVEESQKVSDTMSGIGADIDKQLKDQFHSILDESSKAIDDVVANMKDKLNAKEIFDATELKTSIDAIMGSLDQLDKKSPNGFMPIDTSDDARNKLKDYKADIESIASKINNLTNASYTNSSQLENVINKQINYATQLKDKLTDIKRTISETTNAYKLQETLMAEQIKLNQKNFDLIIENLKKQLEVTDKFNINEFSTSIQSIISDLNTLDGSYTQGNFIESTLGTREELDQFKQKILDIANAVSTYQNNLSSPTQSSIQDEITFVNGLKSQIDALNDTLNNTELQYKNEEAALQNLIDTQSKYYDDQIAAQQEALDNLDKQIEAEDRLKKLQDINDQIDKAKADKRFSYIDANGNETLTYDKGLVKDLEGQRDELLQQYQREDLKQAIQDNIDNLQKAKQETIDTLNEQLAKTKQIHQSELNAQRLYIQSLENLYQITVNDVNSKIDKLKSSYDTEIANEQDRLTQLQAVHQQELDSMNLYASYLSSLNSFMIQDTQNKIDALKPMYEQEQKDLQDHVDALNLTTEEGSKKFLELVDGWKEGAINKLDGMVSAASEKLKQMQEIMASMAAMSGGSYSSSSSSSSSSFSAPQYSYQPKYHTGTDSVGQPPLASNEMPAILQLGETVLTKMQALKLEDIIVKPLDYLSSLVSNIKLPTINPVAQSVVTSGGSNYYLSGITVKANNPTEFFEGLNNYIKSR